RCLLHEKPFDGVNGSGKHNNWSLTTDDGINLLDPGLTPHQNIQFLMVLCCILKAVDEHADLLRESAADVGNEARLGGNEAPPVIISVFLGDQLEDVMRQLRSSGSATSSIDRGKLQTGVTVLRDVFRDATDRNRTSPFAFTGNKFEFRMVGSRDSIAGANTVLNTIVADAFSQTCDRLEAAGKEGFDAAVHDLIKEYAMRHSRIIFNGNGYSDEWAKEAEKLGLSNIPSMVDAIPVLTEEKSVRLFDKYGVFSKAELESRAEVKYELYAKAINIEARTMVQMARREYVPAIIRYITVLADSVNATEKCGIESIVQREMLSSLNEYLRQAQEACKALAEETQAAEGIDPGPGQAKAYQKKVVPLMEKLRRPIDQAECIVSREYWPVPTYADLLFEV
ncbi:MAG: glutamine synthetase type III, partial [Lachnospiraceae bacterium]|nr:glutamine synthetase type III [Lachnospiraceae bacterium]